MKVNAKRNRRLRKKLRVDEFQELGFEMSWSFPQGTDSATVDAQVDNFINEAIEVNGLGFAGGGDLVWEGLICTQQLGKCTDEQRDLVKSWWEKAGAENVEVSELFDLWWG